MRTYALILGGLAIAALLSALVLPAWAADFSASPQPATAEAGTANQQLNFTISNTDASLNLTLVNITIPSGFLYISASNSTTASGALFYNSSDNLTWSNTTVAGFVENGTFRYFLFNVSVPAQPGDYSFTVTTLDTTYATNSTNVTITVSDTIDPLIEFISPTATNGTEPENRTWILWNVSVTEDIGLCKVEINATNYTATLVNATASSYCYYNETSLTGNQTRCAWGHATDAYGNWNTTLEYVCRSTDEQQPDVTPPILTWSPLLESNQSQTTENKTWIFWNFTSDETIGSGCLVQVNGTNQTGTIDGLSCWYNETSLTGNVTRCSFGHANDTSDNWNTTEYRCITTNEQQPDVTAPTISIASPANTTYTSGTIQLNVSADESTNSWWYHLNGNGTNVSFTPNTTIESAEGLNNITVWANDSSGNEGEASVWFTLDTLSPGIAITSPLNISYGSASIDLNVTTDEPAGSCLYNLGGSNTSLTNDSMTNWFAVLSGSEGLNQLSVYCNDTAGNLALNDTIWFTSDTVPPTFSAHSMSPDPPNEDQGVLINVTLTEDNLDTVILDWNYSQNFTVTASVGNEYYFTILAGNYTAHDQLNYTWHANDTDGNHNTSYVQSFTVANQQPTQPSLTAPGDNDNISTTNVTFQFSSTDDDAEDSLTYYLYINGTLNGSTSSTSLDVSFTDGYYNWSIQADDGHQNSTISSTRWFTVDTSPPFWSSNQSSIVPSYSPSQPSYFNITWQDTYSSLHTVYIETNVSGSDYNYTAYTEGSGIYQFNSTVPAGDFYWRSWANDSLGNLNVSDTWYFSVSKAANPVTLLLNGSASNLTITYEEWVNASAYAAAGTADLFRNESSVTNPEQALLHAGVHIYIANTSGNLNYTSNETSLNVTVAKRTTGISLGISPSSPIAYGTGATLSCSANNSEVTVSGFMNGTDVTGTIGSPKVIAAGYWDFECNSSGSQNYTSATNSTTGYHITRAPMPAYLYINGTEGNHTTWYGNYTNATGYKGYSEGILSLLLNGSSLSASQHEALLGAGYWNYTLVFAQTQNYSSNQTTWFVTVNTIPGPVSLLMNGTSGNATIWYGNATNLSVYCDAGSASLYLNGSYGAVVPVYKVMGAGAWNVTGYCTGDSNHTASSNTSFLTVNQIPSNTTLYINGYQNGLWHAYPDPVNATAYCDYGVINVSMNGTVVSNPFESVIEAGYPTSYYAFSANCTGDGNHTYSAAGPYTVQTSKGATGIFLLLNGTEGNYTMDEDTWLNITSYLNVSGTVWIYVNGTLQDSGASPLENISFVSNPGVLEILANHTTNANYTSNSSTRWVTVRDRTLPAVSLIPPTSTNGTEAAGKSYITWNLSSSEDIGLCRFEINGTNQTGTMINSTASSYCYYNETGISGNVTRCSWGHASDASGNWNTTASYVCRTLVQYADLFPPAITIDSPLNQSYVNNATIDINVTVDEPASTCLFNLDGGTNYTLSNDSSTNWFAVNQTSLANQTTYNLAVFCNDTLGNHATNSSIWFTWEEARDTTPPVITITSPINKTYGGHDVIIEASADEPVSSMWYRLNYPNGTNQTFQPSPSYVMTWSSLQGLNNVTVWANDTSGNIGSSIVYFTLDETPPTISITSPANTSYNASFIDINVTTSEPAMNCTYRLDGGAIYNLSNSSTTNWFINASAGPDATERLYVYCSDIVGNSAENSSIVLTIDTSAPYFYSFGLVPNPPNEDQNVVVSTNIIDFTPDTVILTWNYTQNFTVTNFTAMGPFANYYFLVIQSNYTAHDILNYTWFVNDTFGRHNTSSIRTFIVANQQPTQPSLSAPGNHDNITTTNVTFQFSSTDDDAEDSLTYYIFINGILNDSTSSTSLDINFTDGYYNWSVLSDDGYQNSTASSTWWFTIDATSPAFSAHSMSPDPPNEDQDVLISVNITEDNIGTVILDWNYSQNFTVTNSSGFTYYFLITNQSNYTAHDQLNYTWFANDTKGNHNTSYTQTFIVANQQPHHPVQIALEPNYISNSSVNFTWYNDDKDGEDVITTYFYLNGTLNASTADEYLYMELADGTWNWSLMGDDGYENSTMSPVAVFTIDTTPPEILITSPLNQSYVNNATLDINVTTSEYSPYCIYNLDGGTNYTLSNDTIYNTNWFAVNQTSLANQTTYNLAVFCNDTLGNHATNSSIWFTWEELEDTTPPTISGIANGTVTFRSADILWITDEPATSVVYYSTNQSVFYPSAVNSSLDTSHNASLTGLSGSTEYFYNTSSCDGAGNCNASGTFNFTTPQCAESWSCGAWGECSGSIQSRACTDANSCGTAASKPDTAQECEEEDGGGGGGGGTYTPPEPEDYKSHSWQTVTPGNVTISFNGTLFKAHQIIITVNNTANSVYLKLTKKEGKPASVTHNVSGKVYQYLEIETRNLDASMERAYIRFMVNRTWIANNSIDQDSVRMMRYTTDWEALPTRLILDYGDWVSFEAETPGFSYFAIAGDEANGSTGPACGNGACESGETPQGCPADCREAAEEGCQPGEWRCSGDTLQECSADGLSWNTIVNCEFGCSEQGCLQQPVAGEADYSWMSLEGDALVWIGGIAGLSAAVFIAILLLGRGRGKKPKKKGIKRPKDLAEKENDGKKERKQSGQPAIKERYAKRKDIKEKKRRGKHGLAEEESKEALASLEGAFGTSMVVSEDTEKPGAEDVHEEHEDRAHSGDMAYCMRCKKKVAIKDGQAVTMKNGRNALKGICSECGGNVMKLGVNDEQQFDKPPEDSSEEKGLVEEKPAPHEPSPPAEPETPETKPMAGSRPPAEQAWCMKCGKKVAVKDGHTVTMKNGKGALMGTCSECGGHVIRFGAKGSAPDKE